MKKKLACLFMVAAMSMGVIAGGVSVSAATDESGDGIKIGYDIYYAGNTWSVQLYKEFQSAVEKDEYKDSVEDVIYVESEGDVQKQIANIEDLITQGVDVIITTPNSTTALTPVLTEAQEAGIKVVLLAATEEGDCYDTLVSVNDYDFGKAGAEWLAEKLDGKGKIVMLNGISGVSASDDRAQGAHDVFDQYPDIEIVAEEDTDWDYAKAQTVMGDILTAQPEIDGVMSQGGAITLGVIDAMEAAGRDLVPMTGEDNNGFLKTWKELQADGFSSVAPSKPTWLAEEALKSAIALCNGEEVEKEQIFDVPTITDDTLDDYVKTDLSDSLYCITNMTDDELADIFSE